MTSYGLSPSALTDTAVIAGRIPLLMPGENAGALDGPLLAYLKALESFDKSFPGFTHDTHGIESEAGVYRLLVLK